MGLGRDIFAFNGDGDGLCALQQLRWAESAPADVLVTGTKRDTALVERVEAGPGDRLTVLDVSFHANREAVGRVLEHGAAEMLIDNETGASIGRGIDVAVQVGMTRQIAGVMMIEVPDCGAML